MIACLQFTESNANFRKFFYIAENNNYIIKHFITDFQNPGYTHTLDVTSIE